MTKTKPILIFLILLCCVTLSFGQTEYNNNDQVSGTWDVLGSPYRIYGEVIIPENATLTIEPGVVVEFERGGRKNYTSGGGSNNYPTSFNVGFLRAKGQLIADNVTFRGLGTGGGSWGVIVIDQGGADASVLTNCTIEDASYIAKLYRLTQYSYFNATGAITSYRHDVTIDNCTITSCSRSAVYGYLANKIVVRDCEIYDNNYMAVHFLGSDGIIYGNTIRMNLASGIYLKQCKPFIINNKIYNNSNYGVLCEKNSSSAIINNTIANNGLDEIRLANVADADIINNIIFKGSASSSYYGIAVRLASNPTIMYNCVYTSNNHNYFTDFDSLITRYDICSDPQFMPNTYDINPFSSPCNNAGHPGVIFNDSATERNTIGASGGNGVYPSTAAYSFDHVYIGGIKEYDLKMCNVRNTPFLMGVEFQDSTRGFSDSISPNFLLNPNTITRVGVYFSPVDSGFVADTLILTTRDFTNGAELYFCGVGNCVEGTAIAPNTVYESSEVWDSTGSPYHVLGKVTVRGNNGCLRILPGVTVKFTTGDITENSDFDYGRGIGHIIVEEDASFMADGGTYINGGTTLVDVDSILFTADEVTMPNRNENGAWGNILFRGSIKGGFFNRRLKFCRIEHAYKYCYYQGALAFQSTTARVEKCKIIDNLSNGIWLEKCYSDVAGSIEYQEKVHMLRNRIEDNRLAGIYMRNSSAPHPIVNNLILENKYGIQGDSSACSIINNTIVDNESCGASLSGYLSVPYTNNISWGNGDDLGLSSSTSLKVRSSLFEYTPTESSITYEDTLCLFGVNPQFTENNNQGYYSLAKNSPCIEAGDSTGATNWETDYLYNPRPQAILDAGEKIGPPNLKPDMGAFEYQHPVFTWELEDLHWISFPTITRDASGGEDPCRLFGYNEIRGELTSLLYKTPNGDDDYTVTWNQDELLYDNGLPDSNGYEPKLFSEYGYKITVDPYVTSFTLKAVGDWEDLSNSISLVANATNGNWIGFFNQVPLYAWDAFAQIYDDELYYIKSEDWFMLKNSRGEWTPGKTSGPPTANWGLMYPGKSYIVKVTSNCSFEWGASNSNAIAGQAKSPEYFTFDKKLDYQGIIIEDVTGGANIDEIGVFAGDECVGATKVEEYPLGILAYTGPEHTGQELSFQLIDTNGNLQSIEKTRINKVQVETEDGTFVESKLIACEQEFVTVKIDRTGSGNRMLQLERKFALSQNNPNPFNPVTTIQYQLPETSNVELKIYNIKGQLVKTLIDENKEEGVHQVVWEGTDNKGNDVSSGVYFYKLISKNKVLNRKMLLIK